MDKSKARFPDFEREEIADAFAQTITARFLEDPALRNADAIRVHPKTLSKWERGEDLPGIVTCCNVLTYIDGWSLFFSALERRDRHVTSCVDRAIEALSVARRSIALHPSMRERRLAESRLDDLHDEVGALRRALKTHASDEDEVHMWRGPRGVA